MLRKGLAGPLAASVAVLLVGACSSAPVSAPLTLTKAQQAKPIAAAAAGTGSWTVYHHDNAHTGYDSTQSAVAGAAAGWVSPTLTGQIYGEPLVYNGLVYVATLQNAVYALRQSDGTVAWSAAFGAPQTSGWQCGNINPTGTLGTGVIDAVAGRIYYAPFVNSTLSYHLFGLDLATGAKLLETEVKPSGFDWTIQQQRGALGLSLDRSHVYVPFGGRAGDCGPYYGWVAGVPTNGAAMDEVYRTPSTASGIWAAGGVVVDDTSGNVFFATGNAIPCSGAVNSDSVIRTNAALASPTFFQPADWQPNWCAPDQDLGSVTPVLISPSLMFTTGKYGQGFLLNPASLGGTNGQLYPARTPYTGVDVCVGNRSDASFGSVSYANGRLYLTCDGRGIISLTVNPAVPSFSSCDASCSAPGTWHTSGVGTVGPPIIAGGVVWAVSTSGAGLYGWDANTGAQVFHSASFGANRFSTPSEAGGQIFVGAGTVVRSFNMLTGCSSVTLSAAPPSSATSGTTVVATANATGPNCATPQYEFVLRAASSNTWQTVQAYGSSNVFNWNTAGYLAGGYYIGVHARNSTSTVPFEALTSIPYTLTPTVCTGASISGAPPSPSMVGTQVTFTASSTGCPNPRYEFWMRPTSQPDWQLIQAYSTGNQFHWNSTGAAAPGSIYFGIWAKDASSTTSTFDANGNTLYGLNAATCGSVSISGAPSPPQMAGTQVVFTANASSCSNPNPRYEFWMRPASQPDWQLIQAYSTNNQFTWNSTGAGQGIVYFGVHAKDAGSSAAFDALQSTPYQINVPSCTGATISAAPASAVHGTGAQVTFTGVASGCTNPNPVYQFWFNNGSGWQVVQAWSTNSSWTWNTTGAPAGTWTFVVWVRDAAGPGVVSSYLGSYDAYQAMQYTLT